ncbi:MAG: hypothetical protein GC162_02940 [Planctomycetes bacterium]|nr:hypothetical protein [Planctomycetota bacterium]
MHDEVGHLMRIGVLLVSMTAAAMAQSSSLYVTTEVHPPQLSMQRGQQGLIRNPQMEAASYTAVLVPEPRRFSVQDFVTIVIREQSTATLESTLNTEKKLKNQAKVNAFPTVRLTDLLKGKISAGDGGGPNGEFPGVDLTTDNKFEGSGDYERKDSLTTRLTARIVDIKPNGNLTLEARTYIQNDSEKLTITVTGYARPEDVTADNSVLSTQMFDLRVKKTHEGELRKANSKGILTKILDAIFNF